MNLKKENEQQLLEEPKKRVHLLKIFYIHVVFYIIVVILLVYNLFIVAGPYANNIIALNTVVLVLWTAFICIHAWRVFKGKLLFNKKWEDRKTEEFLDENEEVETTFWE